MESIGKQGAKSVDAKRVGRPSIRTDDNRAKILFAISNGESLRKTCQQLGLSITAVQDWVLYDPEFAAQYARSRKLRAQALEDRVFEALGSITQENAYAVRVEIDTLKWFMSKLDRDSYGEKPAAEVNVSTHLHNHISLDRQKEIQARMAAALQR